MSGRRIAVVPYARAGDFILTTGLFNAIKAADPSVELTVIAGPRTAEMARHHPAVDRVLVFDRHPLRLLPFLVRLRDREFDLWLDPKEHFSRNQAFVAKLARARLKVGFNRPSGGPFDQPVEPPTDPTRHFAEMMMAPLTLAGIPWSPAPRLSLGIPAASVERADELIDVRAPFEVLVNVSAGRPERYWDMSKWVALLPAAMRVRPGRFWLSAAPEDHAMAEQIVSAVRREGVEISRVPPGSLLDVAAMVERMDAVLTVDTSIVHIAAVFGRPVVALYRDHRPDRDRFRPLSARQAVLFSAPDGRVAEIEVEDVRRAWEGLVTGP
ncbi:MAG: glycosyltransferase family 9 protein [Gemmatimonadales bacterium]